LSQDIPGAKDDGYFTLNEIMNGDYNTKLVVLSACQTDTGKMEKAEALRQAKLELLKNENYRSPLFWSAFVLYGE
jgi:CHAT domain-containing protein